MPLVMILVVAWAVTALALGYVMGRRGFDAYSWTAIGLTLGPLALALATFVTIRPPSREPRLLGAGHLHSGRLDVLVGVDGSAEAKAALERVAPLFGATAGRITLAHVVPVDATRGDEEDAESVLLTASSAHPELDATTVLLRGDPATALRDYVKELRYDVLVVGTRGTGRSRAWLGSVATTLARGAGLPVLLVDDQGRDEPRRASTRRRVGTSRR